MIGSLKGQVILAKDKFIILDVNGVGYKVFVSPDTVVKIQKNETEVSLWTHTQPREDALDLYGFIHYEELEFFEMLINVSGIGPKGALIILGVASIETLSKAISTGDLPYLTKISGIGKKTAEKMLIELRDKVGKVDTGGSLREELDALLALQSLGYSQNEAREALKGLPIELDTNKKIKEALKVLSGK